MSCSHAGQKVFSPCAECGELVTPQTEPDYFSLFGLAPGYFVDQDQLQKKFYEHSRVLHPDKFHAKSPESLASATKWFAVLNKAYSTLKSDAGRAEYLFQLTGFSPQQSKTSLPPELAEDYFSLQENLEDSGITPEQKKRELGRFGSLIEEKSREAEARRADAFREWESAGRPLDPRAFPFFEKAAREIRQKAYLKSMAIDLEKKCQP